MRDNTGLGGTDISAILGLNPNRTAYDIWIEKQGLLDRVVDETNNRMAWGKRLERCIASAYEDTTGNEVTWLDETVCHPTRPWQTGTPDAVALKVSVGVDAKNVAVDQARKWGEAGSDVVPTHIAVQCQWYMSLLGWKRWDVATLIGGNDFRIYPLVHDPDIESALLEAGEAFWRDHILTKLPPPIDGSSGAKEYLRKRFPREDQSLREATTEELQLIARIRELKDRESAAKSELDALENRLKELIGSHEGLSVGRSKVTWKWQTGSTYSVTREPTRVLRFSGFTSQEKGQAA